MLGRWRCNQSCSHTQATHKSLEYQKHKRECSHPINPGTNTHIFCVSPVLVEAGAGAFRLKRMGLRGSRRLATELATVSTVQPRVMAPR